MKVRRELSYVTRVYETMDLDEAAAMLTQGGWVITAAAKGKEGYLFSLGYMDFSASHMPARAGEIQNPVHQDCPDHRGRTSQVSKDDTQNRFHPVQEKRKG